MAKIPLKRGRPRAAGTVGPVADLEAHLPPEWWRELFDSLYLRTDGDVVENDGNTIRDVDMVIRATGIQPHDRILDLCCGQGRHALELARRGYQHVTGVDRSRFLVRLARRRAARLGLNVAFHEGDARAYRVREGAFDGVIVMGNSFGYFDTEEDDLKVLNTIQRALRSGGTVVLDVTDGEWMREHFERRSWEWIDENHFVCRERSLSDSGERLISREVVVHSERGVIADQFYAERLYSRAGIVRLLEKAGFGNVRMHETVVTESERGQDLGMMAHRLFLTAGAPRKLPVISGRKRAPIRVTVIMGDPRLPDAVKKNGRFNPEDIETIQRLRDALSQIPGHGFTVLDNHATLLNDLKGVETDLVMNLCDEGFNNDAFKEMHIPAQLEMLGLPYTGAGPACLAVCYDKALVRAVAINLDIPVPFETFVRPDDQSATIPSVFPALLKPNFGDSSVGIDQHAIAHTPEQLVGYFGRLRETLPGRPVLVQEFLSGSEYSVCLIGNPSVGLRALSILEVDYSGLDPELPRILGYESKWLPESPYWTQIKYKETALPSEQRRQLIESSTLLFERLACRDYARFDWRTDSEGTIKLLEVNPNPGWSWDGKVNIMAGFEGLRYPQLLQLIVEAACDRLGIGTAAVAAAEPAQQAARA
ncbi:MAG: methyltransferase domain-containing protein [Proteobacteria bacterium]|nr:methyltransferase domain-containing protein [Pseudomonadota bacterium]